MQPNKQRLYMPRLSLELSDAQFEALQRLIPHGLKRQLFSIIVDDLIDILEKSPKREAVIAAVISRLVNLPERSLNLNLGAGNEPS